MDAFTLVAGLPREPVRSSASGAAQQSSGGVPPLVDFSSRVYDASPRAAPSSMPGPVHRGGGSVADLQRLLDLYGMELHDVPGDGLCMRRAAAVSIVGSPCDMTEGQAVELTEAALAAIETHYNMDKEFKEWVDAYLQEQGVDSLQAYAALMTTVEVCVPPTFTHFTCLLSSQACCFFAHKWHTHHCCRCCCCWPCQAV